MLFLDDLRAYTQMTNKDKIKVKLREYINTSYILWLRAMGAPMDTSRMLEAKDIDKMADELYQEITNLPNNFRINDK